MLQEPMFLDMKAKIIQVLYCYLTCYPRAGFKTNWGLERANLGIGMDLLVLLRYWVQSSFWIILNLVNWNRIRFPQSGQIFAICGVIPKTADSGWLKPMRGRVVWCQMNLQIWTPYSWIWTFDCNLQILGHHQQSGAGPHTIFDNISFEEFYLMVDWIWLTPWFSISRSHSPASLFQQWIGGNYTI